jgi:hypothetical protein
MAYDLQETTLSLAYIKQEPGLERGLTYQISANVDHLPSLVWKDPFAFIFYPALTRASVHFDLYGMCELPAASWTDLARVAEETEDRLRLKNSGPADIFSIGSELRDLLESTGGRRRLTDALQLTAYWLREAASQYPTLTFYGV